MHSDVPDEAARVGSSSIRERGRREEADTAGAGAAKKKKPYSVCPHQRPRRECKECGGASICQHQRQRSKCKECGGASICQHQRIRSKCKECGGASICQHQRQRSTRKDCRVQTTGGGDGIVHVIACVRRRRFRHTLRYCRSWRAKVAAVHRCCQRSRGQSRLWMRRCRPALWRMPLPRWSTPSPLERRRHTSALPTQGP